ncbi:hypothetical protein SAMN06893096_111100 [Geodermatophilus pulveris]|uniref:Uncharacterized protein n=1 Tax=Geodermatophilus pulveris TaxID=1564159 RepID=A0A239IR22_9ACTN|nr:hypothetical protein [Geodermatophilus pulveris]SNS95668.1 hypothetical protein SAMN06893096_111100 [Geodermatophilus pulveris]
MNELIDWLRDYSPIVVALLAVGAAFLFLAKTVVEQAVSARLDVYAEDLRLRLGRRSGFEEKILTDRYLAFLDLFTRLQRITTEVNRGRHGQTLPEGFLVGGDLVPLTAVYEDLNVRQLLLGPRLHPALVDAAAATLQLANGAAEDGWLPAVSRLKAAADEEFGLSSIRWGSPDDVRPGPLRASPRRPRPTASDQQPGRRAAR